MFLFLFLLILNIIFLVEEIIDSLMLDKSIPEMSLLIYLLQSFHVENEIH